MGKTIKVAWSWQLTNPAMQKRTKHIDTKFHFIREEVDENSIQLVYTPTDQMTADLLTKALPQVKLEQHRKQLLGEILILPTTSGTV